MYEKPLFPYDVKGFARRLGIPVYRAYMLVESGQIPHRRIGRRVYFTEGDVEAFVSSLARPARVQQAS